MHQFFDPIPRMTPNHRLSRPQVPPDVAGLARQMRSHVRAIAPYSGIRVESCINLDHSVAERIRLGGGWRERRVSQIAGSAAVIDRPSDGTSGSVHYRRLLRLRPP